jgi:hypothetical protein
MAINVDEELRICEQEESNRAAMDSWWQSINDMCVPRDAYITRQSTPTPSDDFDRIFDTTVIESVEGLSNMMTAQLTPAGQQWMVWLPPFEFEDDDEVCEWYAQASHRAMRLVNQSNFATVVADVNLERASVGTGMLMCYETGNKYAPFRFRHSHVGTYTFEEDLDGRADTLRRKFKATAAKLVKEFPNGSFGAKVNAALADPKKKHSVEFTVWHIVKPRAERDPSYVDNKNMPYLECYICVEDKNLIEETGQWEFNAMVSRFQTGANGSKWGVSPARKAMPAVAQANFLQEQLDILLDVQINPRILAEAGMVGEIDMRPGHKTLTRAGALATAGGGVREWLTGGNYPLGKDRIADKQNQIRKLFYHGMWADLARVEKEMTAEEVRAIREQSEMLFVGVNARFEADMNPLLSTRVFGICLRAGVFPPPPEQLLKESNGVYDIPDPQTSYQSNLSRVLMRKAVENSDLFLRRLGEIAAVAPDVLDEFDLALHARELGRAFGFKAPFLRPAREVAETLARKVAAQAQAQQQQQTMMAADAASKFAPAIQEQMIAGGGAGQPSGQ